MLPFTLDKMTPNPQLKTLKDLMSYKLRKQYVSIEDLKAEAIKLVKSGEFDFPDILIYFCNLTAEDLR